MFARALLLQTFGVIDNIHQETTHQNCDVNFYFTPTDGNYRNGWDKLASVLTIGENSVRIQNENRDGKVMKVPVPFVINEDDLTFLIAPVRDRLANAIMIISIIIFSWRLLSYFIWLMVDTWDLRDVSVESKPRIRCVRVCVCV